MGRNRGLFAIFAAGLMFFMPFSLVVTSAVKSGVGAAPAMGDITDALYHSLMSLLGSIPAPLKSTLPSSTSPYWHNQAVYYGSHPGALTMLLHTMSGPAIPNGDVKMALFGSAAVTALLGLAVCAAATFGLCAVAAAAAIAVTALLVYMGITWAGTSALPSAIGPSKAAWNAFDAAQKYIDTGTQNTLNAENATYILLSYEAAAAALNQLGRPVFSAPRDLNDSFIAAQLSTTAWAEMEMAGGSFGALATNEQIYMDTQDGFQGGGSACNVYSVPSGATMEINATPAPSGQEFPPLTNVATGTDPQCYTVAAGKTPSHWASSIQAMPTFATNSLLWVPTGTNFTFKDNAAPTGTITLRPLVGGAWTNLSIKSEHIVTWTGPTGVYNVSVTTPSVFGAGGALSAPFPLDSTTAAAARLHLWNTETVYDGDGHAGVTLAGIMPTSISTGCGQVSCPVSGMFGHNGAVTNLYPYLQNLEKTATNVGQAYWSFLRGAGYTSVNQIPANCIIPNPADALTAYGIPVAQLSSMNLSELDAYYFSYIGTLGFTFNPSNSLTNASFCGKHVKIQSPGLIPYLGDARVNVTASIFLVNHTSSSGGTQKFLNVSTWNISKANILIMPYLHPINITVNTTWVLPLKNPANILYDNHPGTNKSLVGFLSMATGNSSSLQGSAWPAGVNLSAGYGTAVYIQQCKLNVSGHWTPVSVCPFVHGTIQSNGTTTNCSNITLAQSNPECQTGGGGGGPVLPMCSSIPIIGAFVNGFASFFVGIPLLGAFACGIGWVLTIIVFIVIAIVVIYLVGILVRRR